MKIFHYHPDNGLYLSEGTADESPLEPGVWLIPAHATAEQPPKPQKGEHVVWTGEAWERRLIPVPEPEPQPEPLPEPPPMTSAEKLASIGLSVDELRQLLALEAN